MQTTLIMARGLDGFYRDAPYHPFFLCEDGLRLLFSVPDVDVLTLCATKRQPAHGQGFLVRFDDDGYVLCEDGKPLTYVLEVVRQYWSELARDGYRYLSVYY